MYSASRSCEYCGPVDRLTKLTANVDVEVAVIVEAVVDGGGILTDGPWDP